MLPCPKLRLRVVIDIKPRNYNIKAKKRISCRLDSWNNSLNTVTTPGAESRWEFCTVPIVMQVQKMGLNLFLPIIITTMLIFKSVLCVGATQVPLLHFWCHLCWVSKPGSIPSIVCPVCN